MNNHPITLPSEDMVQQWRDTWADKKFCCEMDDYIAVRAAQWGADQELEACCEVMRVNGDYVSGGVLRAIRRPKPPPTLKERALQLLETYYTSGVMLTADQVATIRRALEALPND